MSHEGWPFFGFLRQQSEVVCIACTDDGAFYESRMKIASIEQALTRRLPSKALNDGEHVLMSLLDLAVNPDFFLSLPHKPVDPGLQLWEDDYTIILVAQLASPITQMDAVQDLTEALFHWMDSELLLFLRDHIGRPTLGQYAYLQAAQTPGTRAQRMRAVESAPSHFCSGLYQRISPKAGRPARHGEA
ncbi:hypothetical protein [Acidithiobacillus sulfuriphilus]|uniref:hypothetical protein n=1 Tax=Acidithiobacillus sulfuriphilus TaxID=1867749 RepID=UPI003F60168B